MPPHRRPTIPGPRAQSRGPPERDERQQDVVATTPWVVLPLGGPVTIAMIFVSLRRSRTPCPSGGARHDLHRRIRNLGQEPVDDGPVEQELPARSLALPEHHVRDASRRARRSAFAGLSAFHPDERVAPSARPARCSGPRASRSLGLIRSTRSEASPHTRRTSVIRAAPQSARPSRITLAASVFELMHTITRSGMSAARVPPLPVGRALGAAPRRRPAGGQLPQRRQVGLPKEAGERLLDLVGPVHLPWRRRLRSSSVVTSTLITSSARSRNVSGTVSRHVHAGDARDGVVERFDMLDVHGVIT